MIFLVIAVLCGLSALVSALIAHQATRQGMAALAAITEGIRIERNYARECVVALQDYALMCQDHHIEVLRYECYLLEWEASNAQASVLELAGKLDTAQAIILQLEIAASTQHTPDEPVYYVNPAVVQPVAQSEPEYAVVKPTGRAKSRKKTETQS